MMMLTANKEHNLLQDIYGTSLLTWVLLLYNEEIYKDHVIRYGSFKFDSLAIMMIDLFLHEKSVGFTDNVIDMTDAIHTSLMKNYHFWKEHRPWEYTNSIYSNPFLKRDKYAQYEQYQYSKDLPYKQRTTLSMISRRIMRQRNIHINGIME
jgi:hypothetical protein